MQVAKNGFLSFLAVNGRTAGWSKLLQGQFVIAPYWTDLAEVPDATVEVRNATAVTVTEAIRAINAASLPTVALAATQELHIVWSMPNVSLPSSTT